MVVTIEVTANAKYALRAYATNTTLATITKTAAPHTHLHHEPRRVWIASTSASNAPLVNARPCVTWLRRMIPCDTSDVACADPKSNAKKEATAAAVATTTKMQAKTSFEKRESKMASAIKSNRKWRHPIHALSAAERGTALHAVDNSMMDTNTMLALPSG